MLIDPTGTLCLPYASLDGEPRSLSMSVTAPSGWYESTIPASHGKCHICHDRVGVSVDRSCCCIDDLKLCALYWSKQTITGYGIFTYRYMFNKIVLIAHVPNISSL